MKEERGTENVRKKKTNIEWNHGAAHVSQVKGHQDPYDKGVQGSRTERKKKKLRLLQSVYGARCVKSSPSKRWAPDQAQAYTLKLKAPSTAEMKQRTPNNWRGKEFGEENKLPTPFHDVRGNRVAEWPRPWASMRSWISTLVLGSPGLPFCPSTLFRPSICQPLHDVMIVSFRDRSCR